MEPEGSLPFTRATTCPYPEPDESGQHPQILLSLNPAYLPQMIRSILSDAISNAE
jgi:hypothetical protein